MSSSTSGIPGTTGRSGNTTPSQNDNTNNNINNNNNTSGNNNNTSGNSSRNTTGSTHTRQNHEHDDNKRNARGITSIVQDVDKSFEGSTTEIIGVLALKTARVTRKDFFQMFRDLLVKELDKARDAIPIVKDMID